MGIWDDVSFTWNGTAVERTVGDVQRTMLTKPRVGSGKVTEPEAVGYGGVRWAVGEPIYVPSSLDFWVKGEYVGASTDRTVIERTLFDDWTLMGSEYSPYTAALQMLEATRKDAAVADVVRRMEGRVAGLPSIDMLMANGEWGTAMLQSFYHYPVAIRVPHGVWQQTSAEEDTSTTNGTTPVNIATQNDGIKTVGVRLEVTGVTGVPLTMSLAGDTALTITKSSTIAIGDWLDFGYTERGTWDVHDHALWTVTSYTEPFVIPVGAGSFDVTSTAGTTVSYKLKYRPEFGSW